MERQIYIGRCENLQKPVCVLLEKLILVLLDDRFEPMTIVVKKYAQNGYSSQYVALSSTQQRLIEVGVCHNQWCP